MKKGISFLLLIALLLTGTASFAESTVDTGIWEKRAYVDEFDLPTDEYYISHKEPLVGKFSNSATTDSLLNAWLYVDDNIVTIKLIEYGNHVVKNSYSREQYYDVVMMDPAGDKHYFDGYMESGREVIIFNQENSNTIIKALCGNGTVRFAITETDNETTKYILTINDTTGFLNFLPYTSIRPFSEGLVSVTKGKKCGFLDTTGGIAIPFVFDGAGNFRDGLVNVKKGGKWGFIDKAGNTVIPFNYEGAEAFSEGLACVMNDNKRGFIDTSGNVVVPLIYDFATAFNEGLACVMNGNKRGFIDTTGKLVIPTEYDGVTDYGNGLIGVKKGGKWGYIDISGNIVIPFEYDGAGTFNEGIACVEKDKKWGYIDITGNVVIPFEYDYAGSFCGGLSGIKTIGKPGLPGKVGFIDSTGSVVIPLEYDYTYSYEDYYYCEGIAKVKKAEKIGYIDTEDKIIIPFEYADVTYGEGYFTLLKDGELTIIPRDEVQPNWKEELATREQELATQAEARRIEAEKQKMLKEYTDKETIKAAQTALNEAGYDCGKPDGIAGKGTAGAVTKYQTDMGLNITGTITHELLISLGVVAE